MKDQLFHYSPDLIRDLDIREDSIKAAPFQGEICIYWTPETAQ